MKYQYVLIGLVIAVALWGMNPKFLILAVLLVVSWAVVIAYGWMIYDAIEALT